MPSEFRNIRTPLEQVGRFCNEWDQSTLQSSCSLVTDGTHDSPKECTSGFPLVTGKCIKGGELNIDAAYLISEEDHKKVLTRSHAKQGDLLFANIGNSIGEVCQIKQKVDISIKNLALFRPSEKLDGIFLLSYLRSKQVQNYIRNSVFGSAQPFIGLGSLREFPVPVPPIDEQKAIAKILGTLDEKIELNKKTNETLERIAKALFKSWFIDFDPVRAKAEGRSTGLPNEISDLFPDSFEQSEHDQIPKGWSKTKLSEIAFLNPESWSSKNYPEKIEYLDLSGVKNGNIQETNDYLWLDAPSRAKRILHIGDTIIGTVRPGNRSFCMIQREGLTGSTGFAALRPKDQIDAPLLYLASTNNENIQRLAHLADGGAYPAVKPEVIIETSFILPDISIRKIFGELLSPIFFKVFENKKESKSSIADKVAKALGVPCNRKLVRRVLNEKRSSKLSKLL